MTHNYKNTVAEGIPPKHGMLFFFSPWDTSTVHLVFLDNIMQRAFRDKIIKYVLTIQSEHNYIISTCYNKYQLHVSATILAIIKLYSTYQVAVQCMWCILGRRDLVYLKSRIPCSTIHWRHHCAIFSSLLLLPTFWVQIYILQPRIL